MVQRSLSSTDGFAVVTRCAVSLPLPRKQDDRRNKDIIYTECSDLLTVFFVEKFHINRTDMEINTSSPSVQLHVILPKICCQTSIQK